MDFTHYTSMIFMQRVWPAIIKSLDTYGINIIDSNQEGGVITVSIGGGGF